MPGRRSTRRLTNETNERPKRSVSRDRSGRVARQQLARQQQGPKPTYAAAAAGKIHKFVAKDANDICSGLQPLP